MKFKNILFLSSIFVFSISLSAESHKDTANSLKHLSFRQRLQFNIGGGLMLGNNYTNINILPQLGYRINKKLSAGVGGNFQYYKNTYYGTDPFIVYGGNVFSRYNINDVVFTQAEYQALYFNENWGNYAMVGGGYFPSRGVYISAYYLLLYPKNNNIYGAPYVLRMGFLF